MPQFREVVTDHLVPMLPGVALERRNRASTPREQTVAYETPCALRLKPTPEGLRRLRLTRSQAFSQAEKELVALFVNEVTSISDQANSAYFRALMAAVPRRVIGRLLATGRAYQALEEAILWLETLSSQTYEGRPIVAAVGMTGSVQHGPITLRDLDAEDFSRVLSNGVDSMYQFGSDLRVFNLKYLKPPERVKFAPYRLGAMAAWCRKPRRIALVLNRNGEVLVFKDERLQFAKRRGAWQYYPHESIVKRLQGGAPELRRAAYESCLDISFARTGGCLAILTAKGAKAVESLVRPEDLIARQAKTQTRLLACAVRRPFHLLARQLRQELLSMDGATILTHTGTVLAAGAIVKVPGGSRGGGRRAAALALSKLGLAIKISADGPIAAFHGGRDTPLFRLR